MHCIGCQVEESCALFCECSSLTWRLASRSKFSVFFIQNSNFFLSSISLLVDWSIRWRKFNSLCNRAATLYLSCLVLSTPCWCSSAIFGVVLSDKVKIEATLSTCSRHAIQLADRLWISFSFFLSLNCYAQTEVRIHRNPRWARGILKAKAKNAFLEKSFLVLFAFLHSSQICLRHDFLCKRLLQLIIQFFSSHFHLFYAKDSSSSSSSSAEKLFSRFALNLKFFFVVIICWLCSFFSKNKKVIYSIVVHSK